MTNYRGSDVLSPAATDMLRVLADLDGERTAGINYRIEDLWDPWNCPEKFLPYLAWALSVDVWSDDWNVDLKRRVIAASPEVHRKKGTRRCVQLALDALGTTVEITEWWEDDPEARRGTFSVTAYVGEHIYSDGVYLSERVQRDIFASVRATKPKSRVFSLKLGVKFQSDISVVNGSRSVSNMKMTGDSEIPRLGNERTIASRTRAHAYLSTVVDATIPRLGIFLGAAHSGRVYSMTRIQGELET